MAQTSACEVCDVPKGQAGTGDSIQPVPGEHSGVLHEERATTPIAGGTAALFIYIGAVLAAAFKNIKNRGNELKDLLTGQGITEITTSNELISGIVGGRLAVPWPERSYTIRGRASPTPTNSRRKSGHRRGTKRHFEDCHGSPSPGWSGLTRFGVGQALPIDLLHFRCCIAAIFALCPASGSAALSCGKTLPFRRRPSIRFLG